MKSFELGWANLNYFGMKEISEKFNPLQSSFGSSFTTKDLFLRPNQNSETFNDSNDPKK